MNYNFYRVKWVTRRKRMMIVMPSSKSFIKMKVIPQRMKISISLSWRNKQVWQNRQSKLKKLKQKMQTLSAMSKRDIKIILWLISTIKFQMKTTMRRKKLQIMITLFSRKLFKKQKILKWNKSKSYLNKTQIQIKQAKKWWEH
mgnify:CR=1 FL=1